jgi:hypothetical protein
MYTTRPCFLFVLTCLIAISCGVGTGCSDVDAVSVGAHIRTCGYALPFPFVSAMCGEPDLCDGALRVSSAHYGDRHITPEAERCLLAVECAENRPDAGLEREETAIDERRVALETAGENISSCIENHFSGDWQCTACLARDDPGECARIDCAMEPTCVRQCREEYLELCDVPFVPYGSEAYFQACLNEFDRCVFMC